MDWPIRFPEQMRGGELCVRSYHRSDAVDLFAVLADERVWEHMSRGAPGDADALHAVIASKLGDDRATFTIRQRDRAVGITSVLHDAHDPAGVEIGGTLLAPDVWGAGVNPDVKHLLLAVVFDHGAHWVQLRTDARNGRSAAAILKLGAVDLGLREEDLVRRDGSRRRSRVFRIDRPPASSAEPVESGSTS